MSPQARSPGGWRQATGQQQTVPRPQMEPVPTLWPQLSHSRTVRNPYLRKAAGWCCVCSPREGHTRAKARWGKDCFSLQAQRAAKSPAHFTAQGCGGWARALHPTVVLQRASLVKVLSLSCSRCESLFPLKEPSTFLPRLLVTVENWDETCPVPLLHTASPLWAKAELPSLIAGASELHEGARGRKPACN